MPYGVIIEKAFGAFDPGIIVCDLIETLGFKIAGKEFKNENCSNV